MKRQFYLIILLTVVLNINSFAQQAWGGGVDGETLHFGFKFQYLASEFKILKNDSWKGPFDDPYDGLPMINSPIKSISSPVSPGFALGFVSDYKVGNNVNIRFTPGLVFADILTDYEFDDPTYNIQRKVQSTYVDLPLGLKLKSDRVKNFRAYLIGGMKYSMDIVSKKKKDDSSLIASEKYLKTVPNSLWYEAGIGLDLYFEFFKLSPEIKFAQSLKSVLNDKDRAINPYISPLDKLYLRNFQFTLYFE